MADRGLIHYQPVTGPVWREPVASRLAWLPSVQQPVRRLPPNRTGDYARPESAALVTAFDPQTLQWIPSDRYIPRTLPYSVRSPYTVAAVAFDASLLSWQPVDRYIGRALPRGYLDGTVFPIQFGVAFNPQNLEWIPQGTPLRIPVELRRLGDFAQPPFDALYKSEGLQWLVSDSYRGRSLPQPTRDWTVLPVQFAAPAFDPQNLEWIPKGPSPRTFLEVRKLGDFAQPAFDALYKPEGLQWLFEGQLSVRGIPYTLQSSWVVDPNPVVTVAFDPQFFPFQATDLVLSRGLRAAIQSGYATPPLPPGPDVIPPVVAPGLGGSSAVHPRRVIYEKGTKRKPKTFIDRIGEPFVELEKSPEPVPDAAAAGAVVDTAPIRSALQARLPAPFPLSIATPLVVRPLDDDEDDDLLLLS